MLAISIIKVHTTLYSPRGMAIKKQRTFVHADDSVAVVVSDPNVFIAILAVLKFSAERLSAPTGAIER